MLAFVCPHCGIRLHIEERWAGQPLRCGHCQGVVVTTPLSSGAVMPPLSSPRPAATPNVATLPPPAPVASHVPAAELHADIDLGTLLAPPQAADELGRLGRYRVLQVLGSGGMGVVFRAEDVVLRRPVALKVLLPVLAANPGNRQRFLREAQAAAKLEHDHVVTIYLVEEERGIPYLAMQLLQGETLEARLRRLRRLPVAEVVRIGQQTALALAVAHERGLVHRDIKPANIFLEGARGRVKLLDFGLARGMCDDVRLTQSGAMIGSPGYMAPEQVRGGVPQPGSDLFSLGCVLYRCCTARLPFQGPDALAILAALATDTPPAVDQLNPEVPRPLAALLMQLLARDPAARPPSAAAVSAALAAVEPGAPAAWVPPPPPPVCGDGGHLPTPVPAAVDPPAFDTIPLDAPEPCNAVSAITSTRSEEPPAPGRLTLGCVLAAAACGVGAVTALVLVITGVVMLMQRPTPIAPKTTPQPAAVEKKEPFAAIEAAVKARSYKVKVPDVGAFANQQFQDVPVEGALLIGFEVGLGKFFNTDIVYQLRPIYLTARGETLGPPFGKRPERTVTVKAKPGFAVGAMTVRGGGLMNGFSLTFRAIGNYGLKKTGSYESPWIADRTGGREEVVDGDGMFIIGIAGRVTNQSEPGSVGPVMFRREPD
jgi:serine/threonine protein kinase